MEKKHAQAGMAAEEHQAFGQDLQQILNYLIDSQRFFDQRYGKTKYCALKLAEVTKTLEEFRFEMDEVASGQLNSKPGTYYYNQPSKADQRASREVMDLPRLQLD